MKNGARRRRSLVQKDAIFLQNSFVQLKFSQTTPMAKERNVAVGRLQPLTASKSKRADSVIVRAQLKRQTICLRLTNKVSIFK
jgi:hypothetical protein